MRRPVLTSLALAMAILSQSLLPMAAYAEGEDDPLWNRPSYEKKITNIGQRILAANGITERVSFTYVRTHVINAEAIRAGGNNINVFEDLMTLVDSDDEMAAVLSHEIAHLTLRHHRRSAVANAGVGLLVGTAIVAAAVAAPYTVGAAAGSLAKLSKRGGTAPISRSYEKEADLAGLDYMVKAGYNPLAMETFMNKIASDGGPVTRFFADHPMGTDRLTYIHTAIVNRYPQFLTEQTKNNLVPGSPYQVHAETTIPNRTVHANPNGTMIATASQTPANTDTDSPQKTQPSATANRLAANPPPVNTTGQPAVNGQTPAVSNTTASSPAANTDNDSKAVTPAAPATATSTLMKLTTIVSANNGSTSLTNATTQTTALQASAPATPSPVNPAPANQPQTKTAIASPTSTVGFPTAPKTISYQRPKGVHTRPATHASAKPHFANQPAGSKMPATAESDSHNSASTSPNQTPNPSTSTLSVAETLLELQPDALRLVKLVSQRGMMKHEDLVIEFEGLEEDALQAMLLDLQNNKKLLNIEGMAPNATYVLTPRAARVLRPAQAISQ